MVLFYIGLDTLGSLTIWVYGSISSYQIGLILSECQEDLTRTVSLSGVPQGNVLGPIAIYNHDS